jgi:hypothetical protein
MGSFFRSAADEAHGSADVPNSGPPRAFILDGEHRLKALSTAKRTDGRRWAKHPSLSLDITRPKDDATFGA